MASSKDIGKRVKMRDSSEYRYQAYINGGNGMGNIVEYRKDLDKGRSGDYVYRVKWDGGHVDGYKLSDIEFIDNLEEKNPKKSKIRWYSKGELKEDPNTNIEVVEYNDFIIDDEFRDFLIKNNCYEKFLKNFREQGKISKEEFNDNMNTAYRGSYIDHALNWSRTPEGGDYWQDIHNKWRNYVLGVRESKKSKIYMELINEEAKIQGKKAIGKYVKIKPGSRNEWYFRAYGKNIDLDNIFGTITDYRPNETHKYLVQLDIEINKPYQVLDFDYKEIEIMDKIPKPKIRWFKGGKLLGYDDETEF
jgi:hypothetical protein